jgi:Raf kinase inhibitor-like YbhB/YbcL family protein
MRLVAIVLAVALMGCGRAQPPQENAMPQATPPHSGESLSLARVTPRNPAARIQMVSDALGADGAIDLRHSAYGDNLSPPLRWTPVEGAGAYAIVLEDPDAPTAHPFVHWMIWNIPGQSSSLPEGVPNTRVLVSPQGAVQAKNEAGSFGYFGPRPPQGHGVHHYHFQIFALDGPLTVSPDIDLRALVDAIKGRVLADGELVGTFEAPAKH